MNTNTTFSTSACKQWHNVIECNDFTLQCHDFNLQCNGFILLCNDFIFQCNDFILQWDFIQHSISAYKEKYYNFRIEWNNRMIASAIWYLFIFRDFSYRTSDKYHIARADSLCIAIFGIWTPIMLYFGVKCALLHPLGPHIE